MGEGILVGVGDGVGTGLWVAVGTTVAAAVAVTATAMTGWAVASRVGSGGVAVASGVVWPHAASTMTAANHSASSLKRIAVILTPFSGSIPTSLRAASSIACRSYEAGVALRVRCLAERQIGVSEIVVRFALQVLGYASGKLVAVEEQHFQVGEVAPGIPHIGSLQAQWAAQTR